tara:strand:- start:20132 stop:24784 length:4653 start_codon:yes stop_codon:yes gene_type:complete
MGTLLYLGVSLRLLLVFLFVQSFSLYAACFREIDGDAYGCIPMLDNNAAVDWCQNRYGAEYKPYLTDNYCTNELAAILRGEEYDASKEDPNKVVPAACMSYEQGMQRQCQFYDYVPAERYCLENFGNKFIPFVPDEGKCSLNEARKARGDKNPNELVRGLNSDMEEIETIMTMIDREGLNDSLGGFAYKKPSVKSEFYTDVVKALMAKMNMFKNKLLERGEEIRVPIKDNAVLEYLKYSFRYLAVLGRLYKVYAYVAHENHFVLKTYKFENLNYLNLVLPKVYGLEILAKVNYKVKTLENGTRLEFMVGEQDKQTYEYMAMQDPDSKVDYAKLVTYLGLRETMTNLWGVQRLTSEEVANERVLSCGNFLSFRTGNSTNPKNTDAYQELLDYDIFYSDYVSRWEELVEATQGITILTPRWAQDLGVFVVNNVNELKHLLQHEIAEPLETEDDIKRQARADAEMLIMSENAYWEEFSYGHFQTIVMPGDNIRNKNALKNRIIEEAYNRRLKAITEAYIGAYLWVSDAAVKKMESRIKFFSDRYFKARFTEKMSSVLNDVLSDYNDRDALAEKNRKEKVDATLELAKNSAQASFILKAIEDENLNLKKVKLLEPSNLEELMLLFQNKLDDYEDVRQTLEHNDELAKLSAEFFKDISERFKDRHMQTNRNGELEYKGTVSQRQRGLRIIAFEVARNYLKKYPFRFTNLGGSGFIGQSNVNTSTGTILSNGTYVGMNNESFLNALGDYEEERYVVARDNTRVAQTNYLYGNGNLQRSQAIPNNRAGSNPDGVTTGRVDRPLEITEPGTIRTSRGETKIDNSKLVSLFSQFDVLSSRAQTTLNRMSESSMPEAIETDRSKVIRDPRYMLLRLAQVLKLKEVAYSSNYNGGKFADDLQAQKILAENIVTQAYQAAPILRNESSWTGKVVKYCFTHHVGTMYRCDQTKTFSLPLLYRIGNQEYDPETGVFDARGARSLINQTINKSIDNTGNKLSKFCKSNYLNYKNDTHFKDIYKASKFLRASIRTPIGQNANTVRKMNHYDEQIRKDIRGRWEAWNEDIFEPSLKYLGAAALIALGVVLIIGTGGAATPGVLGGIYAVASTFLAIEFFVSFPLVVGSLYSRINTNFVEVPAQLKFQESLAHSQVDFSKVVDWDMLKSDQKANRSAKAWTIGLMPLDFLYGAMLVRHVRQSVGAIGRNSMHALTGVKLKGFSALPSKHFFNPRFRDLRTIVRYKQVGAQGLGNAIVRGRQTLRYLTHYLPKYQEIPQAMIKSGSLRIGMARKANALKIAKKPWVILDEVVEHSGKLKNKLSEFSKYVAEEAKHVESVRLNRMLKPREIMQHGIENTALAYLPKTLLRRFKDAARTKNIDPIVDYFKNFGEVWGKLKEIQGQLVNGRVKNMESVVDKMQDFQRGVTAGKVDGDNLMAEYLKRLTDDEILVLEEIAKKSNGTLSGFKEVFKHHKNVINGLRPASYMAGYPNRVFSASSTYSNQAILGDVAEEGYEAASDADDLIRYYESMMKNHGPSDMSEELRLLREETESLFGREYRFGANGIAEKL